MPVGQEFIRGCLRPYIWPISDELAASVSTYSEILYRWNERISLTSVSSFEELLRFHFGEAFFAQRLVPIGHGRLADVGSGAGFPGLVIKLASPGLATTLLEPNAKKAVFLAEVARSLSLAGVKIVRRTFQEYLGDGRGFDFVTCRALGGTPKLLKWAHSTLSENGKVVLWTSEVKAQEVLKNSGWNWFSPVHVPGSKQRSIVWGEVIR